jgi:peptidoglycan/xylan/chitin deacetylase (PgdA/CDA1 family)
MTKKGIFILLLLALLAGCSKDHVRESVEDPRVIILMYHRISEGVAENLYERSAADFEPDLVYLRDNNIRVIDFEELEDIVSGLTVPDTHRAIITFDDGDHSWYTRALPLLIKYRMKATFFLWTSRMDMNSFLSWDEVKLMSNYAFEGGANPFTFGSHTMSHPFLMTMKAALNEEAFSEYLDYELGVSKQLIDAHCKNSVNALALPYGDGAGDPDIISAAQRMGYSFIRTSERNITGTASTDLYRLPSLPVLDDTDPELIGVYLGI